MITRQFSLGPQLDHADILGPAESRDFVDKERLTTKIYQNISKYRKLCRNKDSTKDVSILIQNDIDIQYININTEGLFLRICVKKGHHQENCRGQPYFRLRTKSFRDHRMMLAVVLVVAILSRPFYSSSHVYNMDIIYIYVCSYRRFFDEKIPRIRTRH